MNTTFRVFKIFASNIFSFENFIDDFKKGPKGILKNIAIILLGIYTFGVLLYSFGMISYQLYLNFVAIGKTELMPLSNIVMAFFITIGFGFASVATNYYTGHGEEHFLAMPLSPKEIFGAKFAVSFVTDAEFGIIMVLLSSFIYGHGQGLLTNPLFYLGAIVSTVLITTFAIALIYFLLILIFFFAPKLRQKSVLSFVASVFILVFALAYGLLIGAAQPGNTNIDSNLQVKLIAGIVTALYEKAPFVLLFSRALDGNILSILLELIITATLIFGFIPLFASMYVKSLNGFSDVKTKKINSVKAEKVLETSTKSKSVFNALYWRDVKTIFREPAFFANGPLMLFLMPFILIFSFGFGFIIAGEGDSGISDMRNELAFLLAGLLSSPDQIEKIKFYVVLATGGFAAFLGNSTNIAITSFSREGKALYDLKAMPIETETLVFVKFFHALTYCVLGGVIIDLLFVAINCFLGNVFVFSDVINICFMTILFAVAISILLIFVDMFVDSLNPKLQWENPTAAFKQNVNSFFAFLIEFAVLGIFITLGIYVVPKTENGIALLSVLGLILGAPTGAGYWKYINKKLLVM